MTEPCYSISSQLIDSNREDIVYFLAHIPLLDVTSLIRQDPDKAGISLSFRYCGAFSMDVIARTAFGLDIDSQRDPDNPFVRHARKVFEASQINLRLLSISKHQRAPHHGKASNEKFVAFPGCDGIELNAKRYVQ